MINILLFSTIIVYIYLNTEKLKEIILIKYR